ncbi:hypothetical protein CerSpe_096370 [Prunus speciosa]
MAAATPEDLSLQEEQEQEHERVFKQQNDDVPASSLKYLNPEKGQTMETVRKANLISLWQLNALIVMLVFTASGMVSLQDLAFVLFSIVYVFILSKFSFPTISRDPSQDTPVFNPQSKMVRLGPIFGAVIGLVLPIAYIFDGFLEGDKQGIRAAAPHLFLLASQAFVDGVAFSNRFSTPIRVFVPVFFNAKRIFTLVDWVRNEFSKGYGDDYGGGSASAAARRLSLGRWLAIANLVFWTLDLFGFMLPIYLPRAFKKYYSAKTE